MAGRGCGFQRLCLSTLPPWGPDDSLQNWPVISYRLVQTGLLSYPFSGTHSWVFHWGVRWGAVLDVVSRVQGTRPAAPSRPRREPRQARVPHPHFCHRPQAWPPGCPGGGGGGGGGARGDFGVFTSSSKMHRIADFRSRWLLCSFQGKVLGGCRVAPESLPAPVCCPPFPGRRALGWLGVRAEKAGEHRPGLPGRGFSDDVC